MEASSFEKQSLHVQTFRAITRTSTVEVEGGHSHTPTYICLDVKPLFVFQTNVALFLEKNVGKPILGRLLS